MVHFIVNGDYIRGNVETILLKCLSGGELYGAQICDLIFKASENTYKLKKPTLYSALKRLQKDKLVTIRTEESPIGGTRHYYSLTDKGREHLSGKKFDWVYSKLLIDNLVLDKKYQAKDGGDESELRSTIAAAKVMEFLDNQQSVAAAVSASVAPALAPEPVVQEPRVTVTIKDIFPANEYMTIPLNKTKQTQSQIGLDMDKVESLAPPWKPFVKRADEKKVGNFILYNRLRLFSSIIVSVMLGLILWFTFMVLKSNYTTNEVNFFAIGWVCVGVYLLANIVLFSAYPKYERIASNHTRSFIKRGILTACVCTLALSINILAGFSSINAIDFVVYIIVPCILATAFLFEGLAIYFLRRFSFFMT